MDTVRRLPFACPATPSPSEARCDMTNSTTAATSRKPRKPRTTSDTLTPRASDSRWYKHYRDINGIWKWRYFRGTEQKALDEWNRGKPDFLAGREPDAAPADLSPSQN